MVNTNIWKNWEKGKNLENGNGKKCKNVLKISKKL